MVLEEVKGIGPKSAKILNKLGIYSPDDLLNYFPFRCEIIKRSDMNVIQDGDKIIMDGMVESVPTLLFFNHKDCMNFKINNGSNIFNVKIYNRRFLKPKLLIETKIFLIGKFDSRHNLIVASELKFGLLPERSRIEPIYHVINGISINQISNFINNLLFQDYKILYILLKGIIL